MKRLECSHCHGVGPADYQRMEGDDFVFLCPHCGREFTLSEEDLGFPSLKLPAYLPARKNAVKEIFSK